MLVSCYEWWTDGWAKVQVSDSVLHMVCSQISVESSREKCLFIRAILPLRITLLDVEIASLTEAFWLDMDASSIFCNGSHITTTIVRSDFVITAIIGRFFECGNHTPAEGGIVIDKWFRSIKIEFISCVLLAVVGARRCYAANHERIDVDSRGGGGHEGGQGHHKVAWVHHHLICYFLFLFQL